ncbi:hypothetical protein HS088_TW12G00544 [Tripterygium wilfordii]|uniref:Uncharacterized protein n=1 Tax=Tripterygium wilfordii TaxID=458696 RepID=A0A7J7CZE3_TRIWF|nr:uncharacterized protein LOC120010912 [Tripterygium wilfordii]KAF5739339.1 hypothetical protein HS088_TW12G00544 [Tripterygium wilfordii]
MARLVRPLRQLPQLHQHYHCCATLMHFLSPPSIVSTKATSRSLSFPSVLFTRRSIHQRSRGLRLRDNSRQTNPEEADASDSGDEERKSRNQKKRDAKRGVQWGIDLASFSTPQIKRILSAASLEQEVLDAILLVKRLRPDVREGKRRQFNLIGKLLRDVEPELMDGLIQATKDGDLSRLQALSGTKTYISVEDEEYEEIEDVEEEEVSHEYTDVASKWLDGLISKDVNITNEVYSIQNVDFDRQELRKLVRKVHTVQEHLAIVVEDEREADAALLGAKRSLNRFLCTLAKKMSSVGSSYIIP